MAGFNIHASKPVDPGELAAIVASLAGRAGLSLSVAPVAGQRRANTISFRGWWTEQASATAHFQTPNAARKPIIAVFNSSADTVDLLRTALEGQQGSRRSSGTSRR